jgi:hypothetical protein
MRVVVVVGEGRMKPTSTVEMVGQIQTLLPHIMIAVDLLITYHD